MLRVLTFAFAITLAPTAFADAPDLTASGNEPFWTAEVAEGALTLRRLGMDDLTLPVAQHMTAEALDVIVAADPDRALRAVLTVANTLCRDSMSGMPFPAAASLSLGDTTLLGCAGDPLDLLVGVEWQVDAIPGAEVMTAAPPILQFDGMGQITGRGGCNRFVASFELTGEALIFGPVAATRMACPGGVAEQEVAFFAALEQVTRFDVAATGALVLLGETDPVLVATPVSAASVE